MAAAKSARIVLVLCLLCLLAAPAGAEPRRGALARTSLVVADLVVARPLALVQTLTGIALLPVLYPHVWLSRIDIDLFDVAVATPARELFERPIGDLTTTATARTPVAPVAPSGRSAGTAGSPAAW